MGGALPTKANSKFASAHFLLVLFALATPQSGQASSTESEFDPTIAISRLTTELVDRPNILWPTGAPHPTLLTDLLPKRNVSGVSAEAAALAFMGQHGPGLWGLRSEDLAVSSIHEGLAGTHVVLQQHWRGVPIEGRGAWLLVDADFRVRSLRVTPANRPTIDPNPAISIALAEAQAIDLVLGSPALYDSFTTRLVYFAGPNPHATGAPPQLAWEVHPWSRSPEPADHYIYVSARTGEILWNENRVAHVDEARVFDPNPVVTKWLDEPVSLAGMRHADSPYLVGDWVEAKACLDNHDTIVIDSDFGPQNVHVCTIDRAAEADNNQDFVYTPDGVDPRDAYAEVNAFYQAHMAIEAFEALGVDPALMTPIEVVVNYMKYDGYDVERFSDPYGTLVPITNAYYTGGSVPGETGDHPHRLMFGQGTYVDVAYDADVLYHEFGHAVVARLDGPRRSLLGPYGITNEASALNEGLADYFSSTITGDPIFAEYASWKPDDNEVDGWRDLTNTANCQDDFEAAPHHDSKPWAGALWTVRSGLAEGQRHTFDIALVEALRGMGGYASFELAATLAVSTVKTVMGDDIANRLLAEFESRYLFDCPRWLPADGGPGSLSASGLRGLTITGPAPGKVQLHLPVDRVGGDLVIRGSQRRALGPRLHTGSYDAEPNPYLRVITRLGSPIEYMYVPGVTIGVYDHDAPFIETGEVSETSTSQYIDYEARVPIDEAGTLYLMVASASDSGGSMRSLTFTQEEHQAVEGDPQPPPKPTLDRTYWRCSLSPADTPDAAVLALLALAGLRLRRRRS